MNKSIIARLSELEALASKDLYGVVTFEDGTTKRLDVIGVVLASLHGAKESGSAKVTNIKWIGEDNGTNGIMPQIADYLIGAED